MRFASRGALGPSAGSGSITMAPYLLCAAMFLLIQSSLRISGEDFQNLITDAAEDGKLFFFSASGVGGIVKGPMVAVHLAGEHRAGLVGVAADGDDGLYLVIEEKIHVFRVMAGGVDADFFQRADRERVHVSSGFRAGAFDAEIFSKGFAKYGFGEMRAAGVSGAENEDGGWFHGVDSGL